jgi:N-acylneuraminate cytidylyltransferase/CMP-N,N'-diacetyllegionaminic acid synthase
MKKLEICAIILARGGSKRLPGKNVIKLAGKPLIAYTIEAAKKSKYITRIICSTDSKQIASEAKKFGADIPFIRPNHLSEDETPTMDSLIHVVKYLKKQERYVADIVVLLQPTSPLRLSKHIDEAIQMFGNEEAKSLISVREVKMNLRTVINGKLVQLKDLESTIFKKNKEIERGLYCANGAIYISMTKNLLREKTFSTDNTIPYVMDDVSSIDIDNEFDYNLAEVYLNGQN